MQSQTWLQIYTPWDKSQLRITARIGLVCASNWQTALGRNEFWAYRRPNSDKSVDRPRAPRRSHSALAGEAKSPPTPTALVFCYCMSAAARSKDQHSLVHQVAKPSNHSHVSPHQSILASNLSPFAILKPRIRTLPYLSSLSSLISVRGAELAHLHQYGSHGTFPPPTVHMFECCECCWQSDSFYTP